MAVFINLESVLWVSWQEEPYYFGSILRFLEIPMPHKETRLRGAGHPNKAHSGLFRAY